MSACELVSGNGEWVNVRVNVLSVCEWVNLCECKRVYMCKWLCKSAYVCEGSEWEHVNVCVNLWV